MPGNDFSFLIDTIPQSQAAAYLSDAYKFSAAGKNHRQVCFLFAFSHETFPESFHLAIGAFPASCYIYADTSGHRFILVADPLQLSEVLSWAKKQTCSGFYQLILSLYQQVPSSRFEIGDLVWNREPPRIMGILNITPDSFYDGGKFFNRDDYGDIAARLIEEGADIIDIGGESTRPGSKPVTADEEIRRVLPAVEQIRQRFHIPISVDTAKPEVAESVLSKGANMINDTSGLSAGDRLLKIIASYQASYCLMHIQGTPETMQHNPEYGDIITEVYLFFREKLAKCLNAGIKRERICIDPGIGFGKTFEHNLYLLRFLSAFRSLNQSILLGTSNKSFIGKAINRNVDDRHAGSLTTQLMGWLNGASLFRVHDVKAVHDALKMGTCYTG